MNDALITATRTPGKCRWCHKTVAMRCAHHLFARGQGGGRQIDIPCNLVALGMNPITDCECHHMHHAGELPTFECLLAVSAIDHDCLQSDIEDLVRLIQRMPKFSEMTAERYERIVNKELNLSGRRLAMRQLQSFAHLLGE